MDSTPKTLLVKVAKLLDEIGIPYVLTGGVAVTVWGKPRYTNDIDIVAEVRLADIPDIRDGLRKLSAAGYVDEQMIEDAIRHNSEFNYIDTESGYKVDFWVAKQAPFTRSSFERRMREDIDGYPVWIVTPEDLVISKLDWWRQGSMKSQYDIRDIMDAQGDRLDWTYIDAWAKRLGLDEQLGIAKEFHEHPPM